MKCEKCGSEMPEETKFCTECGAPMQGENAAGASLGQDVRTEKDAEEAAVGEPATMSAAPNITAAAPEENLAAEPEKKPGFGGKKLFFAVVALLVCAAAVFAASGKFRKKDPKEVVIAAFKSLQSEEEKLPFEELFGVMELSDSMGKTNTESGLTLTLQSCSEPSIQYYTGSGLRIVGRNDVKNKKTDANIGVIYGGMDLLNLDVYYGDELIMMKLPELSGRVFTMDLGPGLESRLEDSPTVGPFLKQYGIGAEELVAYADLLKEQTEQQLSSETASFDLEALWKRFEEGSQAQEDFKAALTVEEAGKASYTVDGKERSCQGYKVIVSKDAMLAFLRSSADFFLQDETLREDFLNRLRLTTEMTSLFAVSYNGAVPTAEEMLEDGYEGAKRSVNMMLTYLEKVLNDVELVVYVDDKGRMAALSGKTYLNLDFDNGEASEYQIEANLQTVFEGGAYLTQNMTAELTLTDGQDPVKLSLLKQGTYDGKRLTCDFSFDVEADSEVFHTAYTGTYDSDGNAYHVGIDAEMSGEKLFTVSSDGLIEAKKGSSFAVTVDSLSFEMEEDFVTLCGEFYVRPLSGAIEPPEGEQFDVFGATEANWKMLMMEVGMGVLSLMNKLEITGV
ncbi:MAG: zinc ribbon domain-containing protein [Lachnospiraceae bacterium]|nr:zinc ribbon domain-containing protein [Lachnospiraceae bacterium]